ncbi:MAG: 16S rRNA (guanine(527)-N(7))-methyltransferase RsmG [Paracoccaceae bacterium]
MSDFDLSSFGHDVSRETFDRLVWYHDQVLKWNKAINLISKSSESAIWERHIKDSAQVFFLANAADKWLDIGSGGGFPGLVVAILAKEASPNTHFTLMDSDARKSTFLRTIVRELDLNATIVPERIEEANPMGADVVSARALANLNLLLNFCTFHMKPAGQALLQKGENWREEEQQARRHWQFDMDVSQSTTDSRAVVLRIGNITRV